MPLRNKSHADTGKGGSEGVCVTGRYQPAEPLDMAWSPGIQPQIREQTLFTGTRMYQGNTHVSQYEIGS